MKGLLLPAAARRAQRADRGGPPAADPGPERVVAEGGGWLARAQDRSVSADGGVARNFSLLNGWASSYPETTGYIVPTMIALAGHTGDSSYRERAARMLDWLVAIQLDSGAFQGGRIDQRPVVPVTFNTGQILLGLAAGAVALGDRYREPMARAAAWLAGSQDADGCWRRHPTPFAARGEKSYETHVAWGLFEAERAAPGAGYGDAGLRNVRWALGRQAANGWVADCCLTDPANPLTHTLGYFLRGVVEAHRLYGGDDLLAGARRTADALMRAQSDDGSLPGRIDAGLRAAVPWVCVTGVSQIAHSWLYLYQVTGHEPYRDAAYVANRFVRRTVLVEGPDDVRGAVKGSFPVDGAYGRYEYLNWACKFTVDSNLLEMEVRSRDA